MPDDIIKKILDDMDRQGFPLEVRVTETLKSHGWSVDNQEAYFDEETGKQRTVDIVSIKDVDVIPSEKDWAFQIRLVAECKHQSHPQLSFSLLHSTKRRASALQ